MQYDYGTEDNEVNHIYSENERQKERERTNAPGRVYTWLHQLMCAFFFCSHSFSHQGEVEKKRRKRK
ncbi:AEL_collapsed_G0034060.mRNA.1.CDS.1 [Saccharomyces cerevisiae]|nr:ADQ_G0032900.mRNA.1.CDS.1 [Saccharomyces cerevisiae]CAI4589862.1 CLN_G0033300.mRNA.1.CDS.1 [Saccharomyces cerevisiae]CAI4598679.1 CDG_1a_G0033200.mRNA.1.CDS.1 [Saccharomyces cerevisiae]CAI4613469.1 ALH_1b_G0033350.mRNA.1.CDS.1 [Saccharomyces cerevisiae]CAI4615272.1 CEL_1a_G0033280.mRNA.1.CDS.1 [Saccharomyces cerevisiae]